MNRYPKLLDFELACRYPFRGSHDLTGRRSPGHAVASPLYALFYCPRSARPWSAGSGRPRWRQGWCAGAAFSCCWLTATPIPRWRGWSPCNAPSCASGPGGFSPSVWRAWPTPLAAAPRAGFPPDVAMPVVRLACERPDPLGRSRSPVGRRRTGTAADRGWHRAGHLRRHRAPDFGGPSPATLAPAALALSHATTGCRLLCHGSRTHRPLHALAPSR